ncbi:unnamed protein product (macronuclear) [Paramecium tetraurelia]|uniref:Uncharacterized protein n=1 Tax=Paramecium tetraurelia TaxID=5888 RepID=A0DG84_PARTE|nr:uncharacterized protein GSPATT00002180001 [Paramecium tetraurelia]CAK82051.1 unnamed protein product [Paramecium tetraurelia]|eukprot:XP_001449448.1 hypothetical protein (macronuclear) [Paramecium tetraurelia strain d4-2]
MIKHHLKLKFPKQDVVQTKSSTKSTFYIARRIVQSNSDRAINFLKTKGIDKTINDKKPNPASSRAYTTSHYRSYSTTPTNIKGQQSQNLDEQAQPYNTERQQSISFLSSEFKIHTLPKSNRVVSLYQISPQEVPKTQVINPAFDQEKHYYQSQFRSAKEVQNNKDDLIKITKYHNDLIDENLIIMKSESKKRQPIFINITYQEYEKKSKQVFKRHQQGTQKQQIFLQKVLKNIKDSQSEKSESKTLVRKYSKIWKENFSQTQFQEQQKYSKSSQQFKLYFNQFVEKCLNKFRLYQQINEFLDLIEKKQEENQIQLESVHDLRRFYIQNHNIKVTHTKIEDQKFRYIKEITSFGMIDILTEVKDEEFQSQYFLQDSQPEIIGKQIEYIQLEMTKNNNYYQLYPIISKLDNQTKNALLSVESTDMDQIIYQNNIDEFVPNINNKDNKLRKFNASQIYKKYLDILIGNYQNSNGIIDLEHDNYLQQQQQQVPLNLDKKAMMMNLRKQTREAKIQARKSVIGFQNESLKAPKIQIMQKHQNSLLIPEKQDRRVSRSLQNLQEIEQIQEDEINQSNESDQADVIQRYYKDKPVKYKQQIRLQNLQIFDYAIKQEHSGIAVVQLMIEHNLLDELIDYLRQNPNFSLNSRNAQGKPLIMIAAQSGNKELVQYMINQNVLLNVKDLEGNTALHYAIAYGNYETADLLLLNGANPYFKNRNGSNPWNQNQQFLQNQ